jgi:hypothetical protein
MSQSKAAHLMTARKKKEIDRKKLKLKYIFPVHSPGDQ